MALRSPSRLGEVESALEQALGRVIVLQEAYPDLKANETFLQLQRDLVEVEDHLQYARRFYNGAVRDYHNGIQRVPGPGGGARVRVPPGRVLPGQRRGAPGGAGGALSMRCRTRASPRRIVGASPARWLGLLAARPAAAQERIRAYDIDVDIRADGSLDVTERITVRAEGSQIRRGIYRDFPTRYQDRYGNRVVVGFEMLDVRRDGAAGAVVHRAVANGIRINTGNDDFLPVPADYTYTLRYRTTRQLGFFADHDELYWNAIGTGWIFPIEQRQRRGAPARSRCRSSRCAPKATPGRKARRGRPTLPSCPRPDWRAGADRAAGAATKASPSSSAFPKGVVPAPGRAQRLWWLLADNRGVLVALVGLAGLLAFCVRRWRAGGPRSPRGA